MRSRKPNAYSILLRFEKLVVKHLLVIFQKGILLMPILYKYSPFLGKVSDFFVKWSALEIPVDVIFQ